jgi:glutamine synthetase type III
MTAERTARRTRRPMVEMTGTVADLREGDYVDTIGDGVIYKKFAVGSLIHRIRTDQVAFPSGRALLVFEFMGGTGTHGIKPDCTTTFRRFAD